MDMGMGMERCFHDDHPTSTILTREHRQAVIRTRTEMEIYMPDQEAHHPDMAVAMVDMMTEHTQDDTERIGHRFPFEAAMLL